MSTIKQDYYELLSPLVYAITGIEKNTEEFKGITKKLVEKIRFNTYTLTSSTYVNNTYQGIIEKFKISAQEKSAEDLEKFLKILDKKREEKKNSKILEILTLFLNLSKSPTHHFYNTHYFDVKEEKIKKELTWDDILKDDPLTGDHWQIPNYESDSSDTEYSENVFDNTFKSNETSFQKKEFLTKRINEIDNNDSSIFENDNNDTLHFNDINMNDSSTHILSKNLKNFGDSQYWNHVNNLRIQRLNTKFDISNPYTLDIGIIQGIKENSKIIPDLLLKTNYINEAEIVREILFMLMGFDTAFFKYNKNNKIEINQNLSLKHLTSSCINQLIEYFTDKGSKIKDLRLFTKNMLDPNQYISKTMQSFASSIEKILNYLDKKITELEIKFQNNYVQEYILTSKSTTTILSVKNDLSLILNVLSELHIFLNSVLSIEEIRYNNTVQASLLLINLYEKMKSYFVIRNEILFNVYLNLFKDTFEPYISFIESWVFEGLIDDPMNEFFIQENQNIESDPNLMDYWELHYNIKEFNDAKVYPSFLKDYIQKILEVGKSFNLIKELNLKNDIQDKSFFLKDFPTLYEQWQFYFINGINENQMNTTNINEYHESEKNEDKMDINITSYHETNKDSSEDILDIINTNTNVDMDITDEQDQEILSDNNSMTNDMEIYNDDNYSNDIKELKSLYPNIINLYLPNKTEIIKNISKDNIEINNILTNTSRKYKDTYISWIPMDNILDQSLNKTILPPFQYYSKLLINLLQKHKDLFQYIYLLQQTYFQQNGVFWHKFIEILFNKINKNDLEWQRSSELFSVFIECLESLSIEEKYKNYFIRNIFLYIPSEKISSYIFPEIKLDLNLPWPINNIITKESMIKYNDIFSYLLFIQIAFHSLTMNDWLRQKKEKGSIFTDDELLSELIRYKVGLRMKLLHFVNGLKSYIFYMVLDNEIKKFQEEITQYKNFDKIKSEHSKFVKKIWEHCLISLTIIHKNIKDMLNICLIFTEITLNNKKLFQKKRNSKEEEEKFMERHENEDIYEYQKRIKLFYNRKSVEETSKLKLLRQYQHINEEFDKTLNFIINSLTVLCSHVNVNVKSSTDSTIGSLESLILFLTP
ncbi:hypothetical protein BCR32DRAFT_271083 [Anaeromyces robustus]|uniref:Spindle pole body component n=1 Tax=Anaeromyces robustus TaxID=1754192 RepID=A0A1Y1WTI0_9FUNG|nr:hypothetical protein BCR32DRAFT_271083 [Anaeromyces robustus]|eukprot:ORX76752.1 hypothetical protein BCR32DRAFT_271083 [Anaeromyces robustus]